MSDFSVYTAGEVVNWMSQGTVAVPPDPIYVALLDSTGTEVSGSFQNDRVSTAAGTDWTVVNTTFENASEVSFGEATADVNDITDVALYDDTLVNGGNKLAQYVISDTPFDVSDGTTLLFEAGELSFDVKDETQP